MCIRDRFTIYTLSTSIFVPLLIFSVYLFMKLKRKYGFSDKPMIFSIVSVVFTLCSLVIYCGCLIDVQLKRNYSFWAKSLLRYNILTIEGFNIELFMLLGLIFDLYKWCLFIASTKEFDKSIKNRYSLE